jgi:hypothetical protein
MCTCACRVAPQECRVCSGCVCKYQGPRARAHRVPPFASCIGYLLVITPSRSSLLRWFLSGCWARVFWETGVGIGVGYPRSHMIEGRWDVGALLQPRPAPWLAGDAGPGGTRSRRLHSKSDFREHAWYRVGGVRASMGGRWRGRVQGYNGRAVAWQSAGLQWEGGGAAECHAGTSICGPVPEPRPTAPPHRPPSHRAAREGFFVPPVPPQKCHSPPLPCWASRAPSAHGCTHTQAWSHAQDETEDKDGVVVRQQRGGGGSGSGFVRVWACPCRPCTPGVYR